jgi:hypothetical protein
VIPEGGDGMKHEISNGAGEIVFTGSSDAECARWFLEYGRLDDYLVSTGEPMGKVADSIFPREIQEPEVRP